MFFQLLCRVHQDVQLTATVQQTKLVSTECAETPAIVEPTLTVWYRTTVRSALVLKASLEILMLLVEQVSWLCKMD